MWRGSILAIAVLVSVTSEIPAQSESNVKWEKITLDRVFRSEGVAIGDVNNDGKLDVLVGDFWYEAPDWKLHPIRRVNEFAEKGKQGYFGDGLKGYSECMCCWAEDVNGDGWVDEIVIGFPGKPAYWYENPKGQPGPWKEHVIWWSACNESPQYVDLFGNGKRVLVMGWQPITKLGAYENRPFASTRFDVTTTENRGQMAWFRPGKDPTQLWEMHPISVPSESNSEVPGTQKFSHGLGVGDVNRDGKLDVICTGGWWEQPKDALTSSAAWKFHPAKLGPSCADMHVLDIDGDGKMDIVSSSAHQFGIWCYQQRGDSFMKQDLFPQLVSETHALHCVDIDGDGVKDLVTGKRFWSHGRNEPGADAPATLYWLRGKKSSDGVLTFTPLAIDNDSGIGTQFEVRDVNGDHKPDIVTSNKKGVFLFLQK